MAPTRRLTLRDVARIAGVSHNTVSLVVRDSDRVLPETETRVQAVIDHLGYQPHAAAAALRSSKSRTIGYLIDRGAEPEFMTEVDLFRNRVWRGITDTAEAHEFFVLQATYADPKRCRALSSSGRIDGLLVDVMVPDDAINELGGEMSGPVVVIGRSTEVPGVGWVKADEETGAYVATRHLTERGHTAIGLLTVRSESHPIVRERESGFARALGDGGLSSMGQQWFGDWTFESGYLVGQELMTSEHRPTALFALSEVMAVGCQQAVQGSGHKVPHDLAIVTWGLPVG